MVQALVRRIHLRHHKMGTEVRERTEQLPHAVVQAVPPVHVPRHRCLVRLLVFNDIHEHGRAASSQRRRRGGPPRSPPAPARLLRPIATVVVPERVTLKFSVKVSGLSV